MRPLGGDYSVDSLKHQVGGSHYRNFVIQPAEFILKNNLGWAEGNIIKYICRFREKGGMADLRKLQQYVEMLMESESIEEEKLTKDQRHEAYLKQTGCENGTCDF